MKETGTGYFLGGLCKVRPGSWGPAEALSEPLAEGRRSFGGLKESVRENRMERGDREGLTALILHREMRYIPVRALTQGKDANSCARGYFRLFLVVFSLLFLTADCCPVPCLPPLACSSILFTSCCSEGG